MAEQIITIRLQLEDGQDTYKLVEDKGNGNAGYPALQHFFEDIGYKVNSMTSARTTGAPGA